MHSDPIADMLTRIRNASAVRKKQIRVPYSRLKHEIAEILRSCGYLDKVEKNPETLGDLVLTLKYQKKSKEPAIRSLKRISKPGRRVYEKKEKLPTVLNGFGIVILSTSRGLMTNKEARKQGLGGELICEVY